MKTSNECVVLQGLDDAKPHILLYGHESHVTIDVLEDVRVNNLDFFQLASPSASS